MTNPMFNPPPNYSGVTIQIANPAVNVGQPSAYANPQVAVGNYCASPQACYGQCASSVSGENLNNGKYTGKSQYAQSIPQSYPAQYYLNNYNYQNNGRDERNSANNSENQENRPEDNVSEFTNIYNIKPGKDSGYNNLNVYKQFADSTIDNDNNFTKSTDIITNIDERKAEIEASRKNTTETKIVALTDEYIKSLENYLNNPNDEIRLMASKEILTRLDEDKDRFDDAALNALLNKMMQDPSKLVRIAALSAFSSGLASGNDYTVKLLHNIQANPNADKEDVLQAADILLRMTAGTEIKNIPNPAVKDKNETNNKEQ